MKYSGNWHWQLADRNHYYQSWNLRRLIRIQDKVNFIKNIRNALCVSL